MWTLTLLGLILILIVIALFYLLINLLASRKLICGFFKNVVRFFLNSVMNGCLLMLLTNSASDCFLSPVNNSRCAVMQRIAYIDFIAFYLLSCVTLPLISSALTFSAVHSQIWWCCHLKLDSVYRFSGTLRDSVCIYLGQTQSIYESTVAHNYSFVFLTAKLSLF